MGIGNKVLLPIISASILAGASKCSESAEANPFNNEHKIENIEVKNPPLPEVLSASELQKKVEKQISICLKTDDDFIHS